MKVSQVLGAGLLITVFLFSDAGKRLFSKATVTNTTTEKAKEPTKEIQEPTDEIKSLVSPLEPLLQATPQEKVKDLRDFYLVFADIVERDQATVIKNSKKFREYNELTLRLAFKDAYNSTSGLNEEIDKILQSVVSLSPEAELKYKEVVKVLEGLAWVAEQSLTANKTLKNL